MYTYKYILYLYVHILIYYLNQRIIQNLNLFANLFHSIIYPTVNLCI